MTELISAPVIDSDTVVQTVVTQSDAVLLPVIQASGQGGDPAGTAAAAIAAHVAAADPHAQYLLDSAFATFLGLADPLPQYVQSDELGSIAGGILKEEPAPYLVSYPPGGDMDTALQARLDEAYADGGGLVILPAGANWTSNSTITIKDKVTLHMQGAKWTYSGSGDAIVMDNTDGTGLQPGPIIKGGWLVGTSAAATGIKAQDADRCRLSDMKITGFSGSGGDIVNNIKGAAVHLRNVNQWTELFRMHNTDISGCRHALVTSGVTVTGGAGTDSFARLRVDFCTISGGSATFPLILLRGNTYHASWTKLGGNIAANVTVMAFGNGQHPGSFLQGWGFEPTGTGTALFTLVDGGPSIMPIALPPVNQLGTMTEWSGTAGEFGAVVHRGAQEYVMRATSPSAASTNAQRWWFNTAGRIQVRGATGGPLGSTVRTVLEQGDLDAHTADTLDAHDASAISVLDAGGLYTAVNVETALAEVMAQALVGTDQIAIAPYDTIAGEWPDRPSADTVIWTAEDLLDAGTIPDFDPVEDVAIQTGTVSGGLPGGGEIGQAPVIGGTSLDWERVTTEKVEPLKSFFMALAGSDDSPVDVLFMGDSIMEYAYAQTDGVAVRWQNKLMEALRSASRTPWTRARGFIPAGGYGQTAMNVFTYGGTTSAQAFGIMRRSRRLAATGTMTGSVTGTSAKILYRTVSGGGTFNWNVDGGSNTAVNTNTSPFYGGKAETITFATRGKHTINIAHASGSNVEIEGIVVYDGDETLGVRHWEAGKGGAATSDAVADTTWSQSLHQVVPDLIFLGLGINDYRNGRTLVQFEADMRAVIALIRGAQEPDGDPVPGISTVPIILMRFQEAFFPTGSETATWDQWRDVLYDIADDTANVSVIDVASVLNSGEMQTDTLHPDRDGNHFIANWVAGQVLQGFSPRRLDTWQELANVPCASASQTVTVGAGVTAFTTPWTATVITTGRPLDIEINAGLVAAGLSGAFAPSQLELYEDGVLVHTIQAVRLLEKVTAVTSTLNYKDHANTNQTMSPVTSVTLTSGQQHVYGSYRPLVPPTPGSHTYELKLHQLTDGTVGVIPNAPNSAWRMRIMELVTPPPGIP